jgi:hypothetical protein
MRRLLLLACVLLAGCGNEQAEPPDVGAPARPAGTTQVAFDAQGLRFAAPGGWHVQAGQAPLVATIQSGTAQIALWRYPRTEPLPRTAEELEAARTRLEARVRERDPSFQLRDSAITRRGGADAIELLGRQTIAGLPFGVRSSHIFNAGFEVVLDAYAPPEDFARLDATVFQPLLRSLEVRAP